MTYFKKIQTSLPQNSAIGKYISHYYFMQTTNLQEPFEFSYYPHYLSTLNFFKNAQIAFVNGVRHVSSSRENNNISIYSRNIKTVDKSVVTGEFYVIGVIFNPLGFHHFFPNQVDVHTAEYILQNIGRGFDEYLNKIFMADSLMSKTHLLDKLFEANYSDYQASKLQSAIAIIITREGDIELQELCDQLGINRRTLLRHFKQHLGYTIQDFKAVVKFRFALKQGVESTYRPDSIAFDHNYYDQSSLIKYFKAMTNHTPKKLLSSLTQVTSQLIWKLP